jgi:calcium-translocating P-type ATPase
MVAAAPPAYASAPAEVAQGLAADAERGLSTAEAAARLQRYGPNRLRRRRRPAYLRLAVRQLVDPLVGLLLAATAVSFAIGDHLEAAAIAAVIVVNAVLGYRQELAADRAVLALSEAFTQRAVVVRDGVERDVPAEEVVPGDLLVLRDGDRVAADARVVHAPVLEVEEAALTGESLPVEKTPATVALATPLAERRDMVYAGTAVVRGRGRALVCATGESTELGRIETLAAAAKPPPTPLERRLGQLSRQMVVLGVVITVALAGAMLLRGSALHSAFLVGVAVAVAAVPEGLVATVTVALALGAQAMARRGAIVRRLDAIETLGETTVVCTDKTGTLTENRIRLAAVRSAPGVSERDVLEAAVLASSAETSADGVVRGDPIERALLLAALDRGVAPSDLRTGRELVHELPFDSEHKRMTLVYAEGGGRRAYTKGAPEVVALLAGCELDSLLDAAVVWAEEGFRVLAVAAGDVDAGAPLDESAERRLELLGVVALHDPLRESAPGAVAAAAAAGIGIRMLTGDHAATAHTIARALGLPEDAVVARATPADKLALVEELQAADEVVAVTGDGVNDAPALRRADVGVAMGAGGTEAAREAAAIVLTDDDFATIVAAIEEGRRIGDNIRKFVAFLLSANLGEVLVFAVAIAAGLGPPLAVIQVLVVNVVTDGLPALALSQDPAAPETMTSPPRGGARLFRGRFWLALAGIGVAVGAATFVAFVAGRALGDAAQTMAFVTLSLSELLLVFGIRSSVTPAWRLPRNPWLSRSVIGSAGAVALAVFLPQAHDLLDTTGLDAVEAVLAVALAAVPLVAVELVKWRLRRARAGGSRTRSGEARRRPGSSGSSVSSASRAAGPGREPPARPPWRPRETRRSQPPSR